MLRPHPSPCPQCKRPAQYSAYYTWDLGQDIGYGYGWNLQLGSLTPYYNVAGYSSIDHYLYIDGTGAEYRH